MKVPAVRGIIDRHNLVNYRLQHIRPILSVAFVLALLILASPAVYAQEVESSQHFLQGGDPVPQGQLEAVGRVPGCTATLIGPELVLTAAHCVCTGQSTPTGCVSQTIFTLEDVRLIDDPETEIDESTTREDVSLTGSVHVHPDYTSNGWLTYDFALVELDQPVSDVALDVRPIPVELPTNRPKIGEELKLVGFGRTGEDCGSPPMGKREIELPLREITTGKVTLVIGTRDMGSCPGDSGGPALNGEGRVVGVGSTLPGSYDPTYLAHHWIYPDAFTVGANDVHGFHFEHRDRHEFYLVSAYPLSVNGRLTYRWDNVRDPGEARFIRRLVVTNESDFPLTFRLRVEALPLADVEHSVEIDTTDSVGPNAKHGFHFERRDRHELYLVSVYPTTINGRLSYEWDNVRDPGEERFIRRLNVTNNTDFPVDFKLKVIRVIPESPGQLGAGLVQTEHREEIDSVGATSEHGFHFERRDQHQFYLVSAYPTTVEGRLTYEWDNVRDPGETAFIRRLDVINKASFPISFKLKVVAVEVRPQRVAAP